MPNLQQQGSRKVAEKYQKKTGEADVEESEKHYLVPTVAMNQVKLVSVTTFQFPLSYLFHGYNNSGFALIFDTWCKIFLKITHQIARREARPNRAPFFSELGFRKFVLTSGLFVPRPYFLRHLIAKKAKTSWLPHQFLFQRRWSKSEIKMKNWNCTHLLSNLAKEGVGKIFFKLSSYYIGISSV